MAVYEQQYPEAREYYLAAMEHRRVAKDPVGMWMAKMGEGTVHFFTEQWVEAESAYAEAARELHELGYRVGAAQGQVNLAEAKLALNKHQEALELLAEPEVALRAVRSYSSLVELLRCRALAQLGVGQPKDARDSIDAAVAMAESHNLAYAIPGLESVREQLSSPAAD